MTKNSKTEHIITEAGTAFERYQRQKAAIIQKNREIPFVRVKKHIRPILRLLLYLQRKTVGFQVEVIHRTKLNNKNPVIFAVTHIGKWDMEIVNEQLPYHFYIVASDFINTYRKISGCFLNCTGIIWVNVHNRKDRHNTKKMMKKVMEQGDNVMIFPEGAWNLYEAEIVRDIAYGTAEVSVAMNADIIPIAVEQYGKRFVINMGQPMHPCDYKKKKELLTLALRDRMATLKWEIWEREGVQRRAAVPEDYWDDFIAQRQDEWKGYFMKEQLDTFIPKEKLEYWSVQKDLKTGYLPRWYQMALECMGEI